jgi:hypothetical protein
LFDFVPTKVATHMAIGFVELVRLDLVRGSIFGLVDISGFHSTVAQRSWPGEQADVISCCSLGNGHWMMPQASHCLLRIVWARDNYGAAKSSGSTV